MKLDDLTPGERFIVEWQYRMAGGFNSGLADLIGRADDSNRARLAMGFPDEVEAFNNFSRVDGWWVLLQAKAGIR